MDSEDFASLKRGLADAMAYADGDKSRGREVTIDVKAVRAATGKTQPQFSAAYHIPVGTLRDWEQDRRAPDAPARAFLSIIKADPQAVEKLVAKAQR